MYAVIVTCLIHRKIRVGSIRLAARWVARVARGRGRVDARLLRIRARGPEGKGINTGIESAGRN